MGDDGITKEDTHMDESNKVYGSANLADAIAAIPPDPGTAARHRAETLIKTDTIRVVLVTMLEGGELQEHKAPGPITIHTLEGTIDVEVEGASHALNAGELIALAPGVRHAVRCLKEGAFLLTIGVMTRVPDQGGHHVEANDAGLPIDGSGTANG
jgi:quercetin dioxygenase-like cupin family protein